VLADSCSTVTRRAAWLPSLAASSAASFNDVPIYGTSKVPTANAGADRSGALLGAGSIVWADQLPAIDDASRQAVLGGDAPDGSIFRRCWPRLTVTASLASRPSSVASSLA
jgi:hypothetical protein